MGLLFPHAWFYNLHSTDPKILMVHVRNVSLNIAVRLHKLIVCTQWVEILYM